MSHEGRAPAGGPAGSWTTPRLIRLGRIEDVAGATKGTRQAGADNPALIRS